MNRETHKEVQASKPLTAPPGPHVRAQPGAGLGAGLRRGAQSRGQPDDEDDDEAPALAGHGFGVAVGFSAPGWGGEGMVRCVSFRCPGHRAWRVSGTSPALLGKPHRQEA